MKATRNNAFALAKSAAGIAVALTLVAAGMPALSLSAWAENTANNASDTANTAGNTSSNTSNTSNTGNYSSGNATIDAIVAGSSGSSSYSISDAVSPYTDTILNASEIQADTTDEAQQLVEETAKTYNDIVTRIQELEKSIAENSSRLEWLQQVVPEKEEQASQAMCTLYKLQQESSTIWELLLTSSSLSDLINRLQYLQRVQDTQVKAVVELQTLKSELENKEEYMAKQLSELQEKQTAAAEALAKAQEVRKEAQEKAEQKAKEEAEAFAAAQAAQAAAEEAARAADAAAAAQEETTSTDISAPPTSDNADWSQDKTAFVTQWAARIDAYLAGTPLAGYGKNFAQAAWDYGVDPRWSPAISYVESSNGQYCFLPHNAWGWGNISWDSWEEAIDDHVHGLSRGYGYTITIAAAQKYCPPNWEYWYNTCVAQMNMI